MAPTRRRAAVDSRYARPRHVLWRPLAILAQCAALLLVGARSLIATPQATDSFSWNSARVLSLMELARERRHRPLADSSLHNYQARAEGVVYFYLDPRDGSDRVLVRTDQVGLQVYWAQPDRLKQRIVGLRKESSLPNRMYYHLDHLTVVQNGFGDVMRMGDGDEVRDVPHPAAPGSDSIYDFRLADSLTLRLPGALKQIRTYQIDVRPRRTDRSAFVGSLYVDRESGDIVRMTFTFTPASYVDRRLDAINISLDNSLWQGQYWLPWEQAVEIRRQVPELDFMVSSVIQVRFRVWDYRFNEDLPESLFWGYPVTTVPEAQRRTYQFDEGIYQDLHDAGLAPPPELQELRARAEKLVRDHALSGLPSLRLNLPNASAALRYNRGEGVYLGWGTSFTPRPALRLELLGGFAFGTEHPELALGVRREVGEHVRVRADAWAHAPRDIGLRPGMPGALNTVTSLWGDDFLDPFFASGGRVRMERDQGETWQLSAQLTAERQESARLELAKPVLGGDPFRPVRIADRGTLLSATLGVQRIVQETDGWSLGGSASLEAGAFAGAGFGRPVVELEALHSAFDRHTSVRATLSAGAVFGSPAPQQLFLLGGRNTLPGYPYRSFSGDAAGLLNVEATRDLVAPFVSLRLLGAAGWTGVLDDSGRAGRATRVPLSWGTRTTPGVSTSLGMGAGLLYNLLRLDLVRGLGRGGEWQLLLSLDHRLWSAL